MINPYLDITLEGEIFYLLPQKAMFRPNNKQLILSDIHLGKASHFRKQGIAMPLQSHLKDIDMLHYLINTWQPQSVLILGDLFHSYYNNEWLWFKSLLLEYPQIQFILVEGNHDILKEDTYSISNLSKTKMIVEDKFIFSHHPLELPDRLNICGHLHPGIKIFGKAKQSCTLPCFYTSKTHLILPAFGNLTGLILLKKEEESNYYVVTYNSVIKLNK